jgi:hypothetical protein
MARNQPFDFSEDSDAAAQSGGGHLRDAELSESGEVSMTPMYDDMLASSGLDYHGSQHAEHQLRQARQTQTATQTRAKVKQRETTTPLHRKRGNQPR